MVQINVTESGTLPAEQVITGLWKVESPSARECPASVDFFAPSGIYSEQRLAEQLATANDNTEH